MRNPLELSRIRIRIAAAKSRLALTLFRRWARFISTGDIYDTSFWSHLEPVSPKEFEGILEKSRSPLDSQQAIGVSTPDTTLEIAEVCYQHNGYWPISFSWPRKVKAESENQAKVTVLSEVIPGNAYSFDREVDYYQQYSDAHYALTFRKNGWDCFRHVEILGSGSIPVMPDIRSVPKFSMIHYPKSIMVELVEQLNDSFYIPSLELCETIKSHTETHLTSESMANYILIRSKLQDVKRILFVDENLPMQVDYISLLTLIGLKQLFGKNCLAIPDVPYIYNDWRGQAGRLYGRGFGYTRILDSHARAGCSRFRHGKVRQMLREGLFDVIVIGSISRNGALANQLLDYFPAERTIWIHGEDVAPSPREKHFLVSSGCNVFVRSIEDDFW